MGLNGMAVVVAARRRFTDLFITETHPKVLYWHLARAKYDYRTSKAAMDDVLARVLGISVAPATEHEWDAALSAFAALEGSVGRWSHDLHSIATGENERLISPCGTTHYFWPE